MDHSNELGFVCMSAVKNEYQHREMGGLKAYIGENRVIALCLIDYLSTVVKRQFVIVTEQPISPTSKSS